MSRHITVPNFRQNEFLQIHNLRKTSVKIREVIIATIRKCHTRTIWRQIIVCSTRVWSYHYSSENTYVLIHVLEASLQTFSSKQYRIKLRKWLPKYHFNTNPYGKYYAYKFQPSNQKSRIGFGSQLFWTEVTTNVPKIRLYIHDWIVTYRYTGKIHTGNICKNWQSNKIQPKSSGSWRNMCCEKFN